MATLNGATSDPPAKDSTDLEANPEPEPEPIFEDWRLLFTRLSDLLCAAVLGSPATPSPGFLPYWRDILATVRERIDTDASIPQHLTSPPSNRFTITIFDRPRGLCCPCCHPDVDPQINIEQSAPVTKGDLVDHVGKYLYAEGMPKVFLEPQPLGAEEEETDSGEESDERPEVVDGDSRDGRVVVYEYAWMSAAGEESDGDRNRVYGSIPHVVLYACPVEEHARHKSLVDSVSDHEED